MDKIGSFETKEYRFLSNFYDAPICYMGEVYKTAEHLYQSMKTLVDSEKDTIMNASSPGKAKRLGKTVTLRADWESIKDRVMFHVCLCKFLQHKYLAVKLVETGEAYLEEGNNWGDTYWGVCDGIGENKLGKILMQVRNILDFKIGCSA